MSVYGKLTVAISDDARYEKGKTYDLVLDTGLTPDPTSIVVATIPSEAPVVPTTATDQAS